MQYIKSYHKLNRKRKLFVKSGSDRQQLIRSPVFGMIEASCHCGNVKITIFATTETVTSCNCSACSRYASLWAYFNPESVNVFSRKESLSSYCWGDKTIEFHHCKNCGCITHYTPTKLGNKQKMAVNFRLVDPNIVSSIKVRYFDGADKWEFIDE